MIGTTWRLEVVDLGFDRFSGLGLVAGVFGLLQGAEQVVQFAGIGLAQEGVDLFDQGRHGGLFVHGLVGQRAEFGTQGGNHPAGQVDVLASVVPKYFLLAIIFCWAMKPCQQPRDWVYLLLSASYSAMSRRMMAAVYLAMSRPVRKRFCTIMRAASSGWMAPQVPPSLALTARTCSSAEAYVVMTFSCCWCGDAGVKACRQGGFHKVGAQSMVCGIISLIYSFYSRYLFYEY
jgi:hypothetical protein